MTIFWLDGPCSIPQAQDNLFLHKQGTGTTTPTSKSIFQKCWVFYEFEKSMIKERVKAGLERAKAQGTRLGRRTVGEAKEQEIRELRQQGMGYHKIAKVAGVGVSVVQRVLKAA